MSALGEVNKVRGYSVGLFTGKPFPSLLAPTAEAIEDPTDPFLDAESVWKKSGIGEPAVLIHLGLGLGFTLRWYLSAPRRRTKIIFLIEPNAEILRAALHTQDLSTLFEDPRVRWLVGRAPGEVAHEIVSEIQRRELNYVARDVEYFGTIREFDSERDYFHAVKSEIARALDFFVIGSGNSIEDDFNGFQNTLENAPAIAKSYRISALRHQFRNVAALIVAAGPSLDKNIHLIPRLKERCLIFAVERMIDPLRALRVDPDFVVALEREKSVTDLLKDHPPMPNSYLTTYPIILKESIDVYNGPVILMKRPLSYYAWLPQENDAVSGTVSAGNLAFLIAHHLGCSPIVLVGQDLSYPSQGGDSHVRGTRAIGRFGHVTREKIETEWGACYEIEGNLGEPVLTDPLFRACITHYETLIAQARRINPRFRVINATEGGARIRGTEILSLQDVLDSVLTRECGKERARIPALLKNDKEKDNPRFLEELSRRAKEAVGLFEKARDQFARALCVITDHKAELLNGDTRIVSINRWLEEVLEIKRAVFHPGNRFNQYFFSIFSGHHAAFELKINRMPNRYTSDHELKRDFLLEHESYFSEIVRYLTRAIDLLKSAPQEWRAFVARFTQTP